MPRRPAIAADAHGAVAALPERWPAHRLCSAVGVILATVGCAPPGPQAAAASTAALRHHQPATDGHVISYLRNGDPTGPMLLLVHGTPGSATGWADYVLDPPPGLDVLALDRPGFGNSGPDAAATSLAGQAAAVAALLPADGRRVALLGHSLGGAVVARVAAEHPERVSALVLLAASLDPALESIHPMQRVGAWPPVRGLLPRAIRNANAELMAFKSELQALQPLLPAIRARVVIVHGDADDLVPVANVPFMQAHLTGAACVKTFLLPGRDHFLPWNSPGLVRDAVHLALGPTC